VACAVAVAICLSGEPVLAQNAADLSDLSLEDLMNVRIERVFGASRRVQPATEAPSSVTIVTAEDIARHGYRTLADILRGVRGLFVTDDRNYSYIGARGFARPGDYNSRVLLVVDGHRMNDSVFDQAAAGRELGLDPLTFQRVEIIRGPASALYGTSAFFAVVNITTKRGADVNGISFRGGGGSLGRAKFSGVGGRRFANGVDVAVSAGVEALNGYDSLYFAEFDTPDTNHGVARAIDGETLRTVTGRVSFRDLAITGAYGRREKTVPTAAFETVFNNAGFVTYDERTFVDASYEREWSGTRYALRGYVDTYNYDGEYPYEPLAEGDPPSMSTDYGYGTWWGVEGRATRTLPGRHTVTAGLEFRDYAKQAQGESFADEPDAEWNADASTHVFAAYGQDELRVNNRLLVSVGGRYDAYAGFDRFSPRASVVVTPVPTRAFKYLFGSAFRAPNAYELDYLTQGIRNVDLGAETITTNEVVWEEYTGDWMRTSVSAYRSTAANLLALVSDDDGNLSYVNSGRIAARGLELEAEVRRGGIQVLGSYAWQRALDRDTDEELTNSPRHLGKARMSVVGVAAASDTLAVELQTMSQRITVSRSLVAGHMLANVNYTYPIAPQLSVTATIRNLFDKAYADPASEEHRQDVIPQDGRTFYVGLRWNWTKG
jgi:iron complex outermembrane receptor protein